ncbi:hypothetical protein JQC92_02955 [Shewanella sp. 202IG2-18]|uniref:hypothetical protein n=1 Tax=Parashewanella hymeniacidonis TaxID=2807618 RepID=UPI0019618E4D|nr:hypothetical protein [Parashewanella hymeniacidonis]MBM7071000.1 hypothetical protein [Parashewanella hymeniacidonis]
MRKTKLTKGSSNKSRKRCKTCRKNIPKTSKGKYCSDECRKGSKATKAHVCTGVMDFSCTEVLTYKNGELTPSKTVKNDGDRCLTCKTLHNRFNRFFTSRYGLAIVREIKRAGHLDVIPTLEDFEHYIHLMKLQGQANAVSGGMSKRNFHISHKIAVNDTSKMGLLNKDNLVLAPAELNLHYGNKSIFQGDNFGLFLIRNKLLPTKIDKSTSTQFIKDLLYKRFGHELVVKCYEWDFPRYKKNTNTDFSKDGLEWSEVAAEQASDSDIPFLKQDSHYGLIRQGMAFKWFDMQLKGFDAHNFYGDADTPTLLKQARQNINFLFKMEK